MLEFVRTFDLLGSISQFLQERRKSLGLAETKLRPRLLNQERGGLILYTWTDRSEDSQVVGLVTHVGCFDPTTQTHKVLWIYNQRVKIVSCSVNRERTLMGFTIVSKQDVGASDGKPKELYQAFLAELQSLDTRVFSLNLQRNAFLKVQFLHPDTNPSSSTRGSHMLVFLHKESIGLYKIHMGRIGDRGIMMSGQPDTEQIVRRFVWAQWDAHNQRLYYIHTFRHPQGKTELVGSKLSALQFNVAGSFDNMIDIPINFPFPVVRSSTRASYADLSLYPGIPDVHLNVFVLSQNNGSLCICYQEYIHSSSQAACAVVPKDTEDDEDPNIVDVKYYVCMVHHAKTLHGCATNLPRSLVAGRRVVFQWFGDYLMVALPGVFCHLLNVNVDYEPCHNILLHNHDIQAGERAAAPTITVSDTTTSDHSAAALEAHAAPSKAQSAAKSDAPSHDSKFEKVKKPSRESVSSVDQSSEDQATTLKSLSDPQKGLKQSASKPQQGPSELSSPQMSIKEPSSRQRLGESGQINKFSESDSQQKFSEPAQQKLGESAAQRRVSDSNQQKLSESSQQQKVSESTQRSVSEPSSQQSLSLPVQSSGLSPSPSPGLAVSPSSQLSLSPHPQSSVPESLTNVVVTDRQCQKFAALLAPCYGFSREAGASGPGLYDIKGGYVWRVVSSPHSLVDAFRSAYWQTQLAILHYLIMLRTRDIHSVRQVFEVITEDPTSQELNIFLSEVLVASTFASMRKKMDREVVQLLSFTAADTFRGQFEKNRSGERLARVTYSSLESVNISTKASQERRRRSSEDGWDLLRKTLRLKQMPPVLRFSHNHITKALQDVDSTSAKKKWAWVGHPTEGSFFDGMQTVKLTDVPHFRGKGADKRSGRRSQTETVLGGPPLFLQTNLAVNPETKKMASSMTEQLLVSHLQRYLKKESRAKAHNIAKEYLLCQAQQSQQLCHLLWSIHSEEETTAYERLLPRLDEVGTDREYRLFQVFERFYLATQELAFPQPAGFASYFTSLGFKCLTLSLFLQYVDRGILQLTPDFILQLLEDLPDSSDEENPQIKFHIISRLPKPFAEDCYQRWKHPVTKHYAARDQVAQLLQEGMLISKQQDGDQTDPIRRAREVARSRAMSTDSRSTPCMAEISSFKPLSIFLRHLEETAMEIQRVKPGSTALMYDFNTIEEAALSQTRDQCDLSDVNF